MKKVILSSILSLAATTAFAGGSNHYAIAKKLAALNGKTGAVVESYDNGTQAGDKVVSEQDRSGYTVNLEVMQMYFNPVATVMMDTVKVINESSLLVSTNSDRAGGDACGDFGGATGYKKILTVENNTVTIAESFRCALEGFKKYELSTTCKF
jgi:hypothetical protein